MGHIRSAGNAETAAADARNIGAVALIMSIAGH